MSNEVNISVKDRNGKIHKLNVPIDMSFNLMEACKIHEIDIDGICGGIAMCASCQCYILSSHKLNVKSLEEEAMLSEASYVSEKSRLGCQILITKDLDGLEIELAPKD